MQGIMVMGLCKDLYVRKLQNSIFKYWNAVLQILGFQRVVRTHLSLWLPCFLVRIQKQQIIWTKTRYWKF